MSTETKKLVTPSRVVVIALCSKHWMASELDRYILVALGPGWDHYEHIRDFITAKANNEYSWASGRDLKRFIDKHISN